MHLKRFQRTVRTRQSASRSTNGMNFQAGQIQRIGGKKSFAPIDNLTATTFSLARYVHDVEEFSFSHFTRQNRYFLSPMFYKVSIFFSFARHNRKTPGEQNFLWKIPGGIRDVRKAAENSKSNAEFFVLSPGRISRTITELAIVNYSTLFILLHKLELKFCSNKFHLHLNKREDFVVLMYSESSC